MSHATLWLHVRETVKARASEFMLGLIAFNMSAVLVVNGTLFADNPKAYAGLIAFASQETWVLVCAAVGGSRLVVLMINGFWYHSPVARSIAAFISCYVWFQLTWGVVTTGTYGFGLAIYPVLLLFDSYNVLRTVDDVITEHRGAGRGRSTWIKH